MTTLELSEPINKLANWDTNGLLVRVVIVDTRRVFNRTDYQIKPVSGTGFIWVAASSVHIIKETAVAS